MQEWFEPKVGAVLDKKVGLVSDKCDTTLQDVKKGIQSRGT